MKKCLALFFAVGMTSVHAWEIGEQAYIYNIYNDVQHKKEFALVEIEDIKGNRAKVVAKAACNDNGWAGKGCKTGWFSSYEGMRLNDTKWVRLDELLTTWEDKVR